MHRLWLAASLLCAWLALASGHARAQTPEPSEPSARPEAERLFHEGVAAANAGDYATACAKLSKSLDLVPRASTMLNLAVCEAEQGKLASALKRYKTGVALLPPGDARLEKAAADMEALSKRVPRLTVKLAPSTPEQARVLIDGNERPRGELVQVPLDPGEHVVVLAAPGYRDATQRVLIKEGERITATLTPGAPVAVEEDEKKRSTVEVTPVAADDPTLRIAGFVVLGVGVLGAIGAGVTGGLLLANDGTIEEQCPNQQCSNEGLETIDESETLIIVNYVSWGVAIAGVGTGVGLIVADILMGDSEEAEVEATVIPGGGFAGVKVRF